MTMSIAGKAGMVWGTNRAHDRSVIKAACEQRGWNRIVCRPPSKTVALAESVKFVARLTPIEPDLPLTVRTLSDGVSWEALRVRKAKPYNEYIQVLSAEVTPPDTLTLLGCHPALDQGKVMHDLQQAYDARRNLMSPSQVRTAVASVMRRLQAVQLGAANLYFVPHESVDAWRTFRDDAQLWRYHMMPMEAAADPATVEHIIARLHEETAEDIRLILEEMQAGMQDDRKVRRLIQRSKSVIDKIKSYEAALGQQLDWMREPLEQAHGGLAVGQLYSVAAG